MWVLMELVAMATDLAEFLGAAVALNLLFGLPLWIAGLLTAIITFLILGLERYGFRPLEAVITGFLAIIAISYVIEMFLGHPAWGAIAHATFIPHFTNSESILLATGILGATVMPHAIFLHSALTQGRVVVKKPEQLRRLFRFEIIDVVIAMVIASSVNAAMLITAAATFFKTGHECWHPGTSLSDPPTTARSCRGNCVWCGAAGFRAILLFGRDDGRAGHHAGFPALPYPPLDPPGRDDHPFADRHLYRP